MYECKSCKRHYAADFLCCERYGDIGEKAGFGVICPVDVPDEGFISGEEAPDFAPDVAVNADEVRESL